MSTGGSSWCVVQWASCGGRRTSVAAWHALLTDSCSQIDNLDSDNKGGMAIGVVTSTFPVDTGILGANVNSWAYSGRTGDIGDGSGRFVSYGEPYGTGDRVAIVLDMSTAGGVLRFLKNGRDQGVAYSGVFSQGVIGVGLSAAVCIGGVQRHGGFHRVSLLPVAATFSTTRRHPLIELENYNTTARGSVKPWGTVLVDGVAVSSGVHTWELHVR